MSRIARETPFNEKGRCCWCNTALTGRRTRWCSDACSGEWMVRVSPAWAAAKVWKRDHGVCALCGTDTERQRRAFRRLLQWGKPRWSERQHRWANYGRVATRPAESIVRSAAMHKYGVPWSRLTGQNWWDCDHIVPVIEGGGGCGLDNLRTLCIPCHKGETRKLAARRADRRKTQEPLDFGGAA